MDLFEVNYKIPKPLSERISGSMQTAFEKAIVQLSREKFTT
jgi:hypothetical protein